MDEGGGLFLSRDITKGGKLQIRQDDRLGRSVRGISGYFRAEIKLCYFCVFTLSSHRINKLIVVVSCTERCLDFKMNTKLFHLLLAVSACLQFVTSFPSLSFGGQIDLRKF
jgi:hypothetical protein